MSPISCWTLVVNHQPVISVRTISRCLCKFREPARMSCCRVPVCSENNSVNSIFHVADRQRKREPRREKERRGEEKERERGESLLRCSDAHAARNLSAGRTPTTFAYFTGFRRENSRFSVIARKDPGRFYVRSHLRQTADAFRWVPPCQSFAQSKFGLLSAMRPFFI